jgi:hypothetical protein
MAYTRPFSPCPCDRPKTMKHLTTLSPDTSCDQSSRSSPQHRRIAILGVPSRVQENGMFGPVFRAKLIRMNYLQCIVLDKACSFITLQKPWCIFCARNANPQCPNAGPSPKRGSAARHIPPSPYALEAPSVPIPELFARFASGNSIATLCYPTVMRNVARYSFQARK